MGFNSAFKGLICGTDGKLCFCNVGFCLLSDEYYLPFLTTRVWGTVWSATFHTIIKPTEYDRRCLSDKIMCLCYDAIRGELWVVKEDRTCKFQDA